MTADVRPSFRITGEVTFLALLAIAFPMLFALALVVAGGLLVLAVGHFAGFLLKLLWVLVFPLFAGLRGLWSSGPPTTAQPLVAQQSPELFATIERLRAHSKAARIHAVYLTGALNAEMRQIPRHGIFGGTRNELHLGLPLMAAMDEAHFTAVLAHEIGHLARRHGSFSARIYGMRETLELVLEELDRRRSPLIHPVAAFYRALMPRFERSTLQLSRAVEFEADAAAASAVGAHVAAEALVLLHGIVGYCNAEVWPAIFRAIDEDQPLPPDDVYAQVAAAFRQPIPDGHRFVAAALAERTATVDTHPALEDRLRALGADSASLHDALDRYAVPERSAADAFLAGAVAQRKALAYEWYCSVRGPWQQQHAERKALRERLAALDALGERAGRAERVERALAAAQLRRPDASALLVETSDAFPDEAELAMRAANALAELDDVRAAAYYDRAIVADPSCAVTALALEHALFGRLHDEARLAECEARLRASTAELNSAREERSRFTGAEPVEAHGLGEEELAQVRRALDLPDVTAAYLARRRLTYLAGVPQFVLAVARVKRKNAANDEDIAKLIADDLSAFPYAVTVVVSSKPRNAVVDALQAVPGTQLRL